VSKLQNLLKQAKISDKVSSESAVFLSAVIEYLSAEVLEISGEKSRLDPKMKRRKNPRIEPRHIFFAAKEDEELYSFLGKQVIIPSAATFV